MEYDAELHINHSKTLVFSLEAFWIGDVRLNFHFKGSEYAKEYEYPDCLVYITHDELELVKNFLTTIRS